MARPRTTIDPPPFAINPENLAKVPSWANIVYKEFAHTQRNGDIYKYYRAVYYSPETQKNVHIQTKLYGVVRADDVESGALSKTRPRNFRELERQEALQEAVRKEQARREEEDREKALQQENVMATVAPVVESMTDTRVGPCRYELDHVMLAALFTCLSGQTGALATADYANNYADEFKKLIPGFSACGITSESVRQLFMLHRSDGVADVGELVSVEKLSKKMQVLSMDGQAVRASRNGKEKPHMIMTLFAADSKTAIRQILIEEKSNEIPAAPKLMGDIDATGCIVTADALNTQVETATAIIQSHGHYCLALKGNQNEINEAVRCYFRDPAQKEKLKIIKKDCEIGHGRIEQREYRFLPASLLLKRSSRRWPGLSEGTLVMAISHTEMKKGDREPVEETRYFISSLRYEDPDTIESLADAVRAHWAIENNLHWKLDVIYRQDRMQCRDPSYLACCSALMKVAYNYHERLLEVYKEAGNPISTERLMARMRTPFQILKELKKLVA